MCISLLLFSVVFVEVGAYLFISISFSQIIIIG
jgi:hypothetical protein